MVLANSFTLWLILALSLDGYSRGHCMLVEIVVRVPLYISSILGTVTQSNPQQ